MNRPQKRTLTIILCFLVLAGCQPGVKPIYLRENGDLSYYLDQQVETAYPDVAVATLEEVANARSPWTLEDQDIVDFWDISLEDAISVALQNAKVIRGYGSPGLQGSVVGPGVDSLTSTGLRGTPTTYMVAIQESEPGFLTTPGQIATASALTTGSNLFNNGQGVEAALSEFDAHFTSSVFVSNTDRPQNFAIQNLDARLFQDYSTTFQAELTKKTANGTQLFFRNTTDYRRNNNPLLAAGGAQIYPRLFTTAIEAEARQPLLRGRGTAINRMPVIMARINGDQQVASFEESMHNFLTNVEIQYWNLQCGYREFEAAKEARDSALEVFNIERKKFEIGSTERGRGGTKQTVAQAQEQYFFFRAEVERVHSDLMDREGDLRYLMGIAATDGRFLRPSDEPTTAYVNFDWNEANCQALSMRPLLRRERWEIKRRELAVQYAKNSLLPQLNATVLYRWLGLGDELIRSSRTGNNFGDPAGATAFDILTEGDFQEFRFGLEYGVPIGLRKELANVRNTQLQLARSIAILEDLELDVSRELTQAYRALIRNYKIAVSHYNRWLSAEAEAAAFDELQQSGQSTVDLALDAQRRKAQAKVAFYQSVCEYNKTIALMHHRKGTTLDYYGVSIGEGPWPNKAYDDAYEHARRRGASREMNYGYTRPGVVSLDGGTRGAGGIAPSQPFVEGEIIDGGYIDEGYQNYQTAPYIENEIVPGEIAPAIDGPIESIPSVPGQPITQVEQPGTPPMQTQTVYFSDQPVGSAVQPSRDVRQATARLKIKEQPSVRNTSVAPSDSSNSSSVQTRSPNRRSRSRAVIRSVNNY